MKKVSFADACLARGDDRRGRDQRRMLNLQRIEMAHIVDKKPKWRAERRLEREMACFVEPFRRMGPRTFFLGAEDAETLKNSRCNAAFCRFLTAIRVFAFSSRGLEVAPRNAATPFHANPDPLVEFVYGVMDVEDYLAP